MKALGNWWRDRRLRSKAGAALAVMALAAVLVGVAGVAGVAGASAGWAGRDGAGLGARSALRSTAPRVKIDGVVRGSLMVT